MTPMFVETLNSQAQESVASQPGTMRGKLRATQTSLEFSQTQTTGTGNPPAGSCSTQTSRGASVKAGVAVPPNRCVCSTGHRTTYNWLTGRSMDTLAEYTLGSESASSSLMVFDKDERRIRARKPVGEGFGSKLLAGSGDRGDGPATGWCRYDRSAWLRRRRRRRRLRGVLCVHASSQRAAQQHSGAETQVPQGSEERQLGLRTEGDPTAAEEKGSKHGGRSQLFGPIFIFLTSRTSRRKKQLIKSCKKRFR